MFIDNWQPQKEVKSNMQIMGKHARQLVSELSYHTQKTLTATALHNYSNVCLNKAI